MNNVVQKSRFLRKPHPNSRGYKAQIRILSLFTHWHCLVSYRLFAYNSRIAVKLTADRNFTTHVKNSTSFNSFLVIRERTDFNLIYEQRDSVILLTAKRSALNQFPTECAITLNTSG